MKLCLVGYGAIAEKHMEAFSTIEEVEPYILVGRQTESIGTGDSFICPKGITHGLKNTGSQPLCVLCIFTPPLA